MRSSLMASGWEAGLPTHHHMASASVNMTVNKRVSCSTGLIRRPLVVQASERDMSTDQWQVALRPRST